MNSPSTFKTRSRFGWNPRNAHWKGKGRNFRPTSRRKYAPAVDRECSMDSCDPPARITCRCRDNDGSVRMHTLYLRADEQEYAWVYATLRREAIDGVDLVTVVIPKD